MFISEDLWRFGWIGIDLVLFRDSQNMQNVMIHTPGRIPQQFIIYCFYIDPYVHSHFKFFLNYITINL